MATITVVASGTVNYKYVAVISGSTPLATAYGSSTLVVDTIMEAPIWLGMCM
jgi:hypothetical protein